MKSRRVRCDNLPLPFSAYDMGKSRIFLLKCSMHVAQAAANQKMISMNNDTKTVIEYCTSAEQEGRPRTFLILVGSNDGEACSSAQQRTLPASYGVETNTYAVLMPCRSEAARNAENRSIHIQIYCSATLNFTCTRVGAMINIPPERRMPKQLHTNMVKLAMVRWRR